jgi:hypothetical protein
LLEIKGADQQDVRPLKEIFPAQAFAPVSGSNGGNP